MLNFTRQEKLVLLFLVISFLIGGGIHVYKDWIRPDGLSRQEVMETAERFKEQARQVDSACFADKQQPAEKQQTVININQADLKTLCQIKGIGPSTAEKIIKYREENGMFKSIDELTNIKGIGTKTIEKIKGEVSIE